MTADTAKIFNAA